MSNVDLLIAEIYKKQSTKLLAILTRIFGAHNFELIEDVLQEAVR